MKRIIAYKTLFGIKQNTDLAQLKTIYRDLIKEWHPDKIQDDDLRKAEAEEKSRKIINAYHFLVSISPETHLKNKEQYTHITTNSVIDDFVYKDQTLRITFSDNSSYEYFGVPKSIYNKLINSSTKSRFARRHIYHSYTYRNISKKAA